MFGWIDADCLAVGDGASGQKVRLPLDLAVSPPGEAILRHVDTHGLAADLDFLLARLGRAGRDRVIVVDLTRPDLDIPVVRVPGLACFAVNQRRVGWRCKRHLL